MGRYIQISEVVNEMPEIIQALTTNDTTGSSVNETVLESRIKSAESLFESYISGRYDVPYLLEDDTAPEIVKHTILVILKYMLYTRRNALTPDIQAQYDGVIRFLNQVSAGKANLPKIKPDGEVESTGNPSWTVGNVEEERFDEFV